MNQLIALNLTLTIILTLKTIKMSKEVAAIKADLAEAKKLTAKIAADQNSLNDKIQAMSDRPTIDEIIELKELSASLVTDLSDLDSKVEDAPEAEAPAADETAAEAPAVEDNVADAPATEDAPAAEQTETEETATETAGEAEAVTAEGDAYQGGAGAPLEEGAETDENV